MYCEICGRRTQGKMSLVLVRGATLHVCAECSKGRTRVRTRVPDIDVAPVKPKVVRKEPFALPQPKPSVPKQELELSLRPVQGYGRLMHKAREAKGMSVEDFSRVIGMRESLIRKAEGEKITPSISDLRKIERSLGVKLVETYSDDMDTLATKSDSTLTLGEVAKMRRLNENEES
ncbi:MAG TPA: multiprotein bridging factor aMBF1 [Thermoproteota archaeon]|nr:multiprotein bridging factor aMBF1 [Thermoproteota archaeon]